MRYPLLRFPVTGLGSKCIRCYSTEKTFSNQSKLPRLPIPDLEATATRYKRSLLPLLSQSEYDEACAKVDRFVKGQLGRALQDRLHRLDEQEAKRGLSWLDQIWLNKAYLEYRAPTLINVNWWNQFRDPPQGLESMPTPPPGAASDFQLNRAAKMIVGIVEYSNKVNREEIPPEVTRAGPMCMHQIKNLFGTSRIAAMPRDRVVTQWPATSEHITILYKDQIFAVPVFDNFGQVLSEQAVKRQLQRVVHQVDQASSDQIQPPVGIMTSEHRDTWAKVRQELETNPVNAKTFESIDSSLFAICLDDYSSPADMDRTHRNFFHGKNARNRWFDKALQFIIETNGRAGINGEHSPADAVIPSRIFDYILERENDPALSGPSTTSAPEPVWLQWSISTDVAAALETAQANAIKLIDNLDSVLLHYHAYGSDFMKKAKVSPDGWMQMVYQLAYYRHYGKPCPTYESASTRKFLTGRTETVRSCSVESVAFTKAWEDKDVKMKDKLALLDKAIASHLEYMKAAINGHGVDRHLLGLRTQMTPEEAESEEAAIFKDPSYWKSQYWILSTSNTSPGDVSWGGFGAVVPEGYGINYAIGKERVRMSVSSWKSAKETDSDAFRETIQDVLDEFGEVAERYLIKS